MTVIVQAVMIGQQVVVVAQLANPPMAIAVKRGRPVVAALKATVAQSVIVVQSVMPVQIVIAALKGAIIKPTQPAAARHHSLVSHRSVTSQHAAASHHSVTNQHAAASHHPVTNQHVAASHHLAASLPLTNAQILVISQRRKSHHPAAAMVARNAHHLRQKSASAHRGQAVMPHRRAAKAH
jgi:hypothetical protein